MFGKPKEASELDKAITQIHDQLEDETPESEEYAQMVDQLVKLYAIKKDKPSWKPSADTLAIVMGNFAGVLAIISYERLNMITSKALSHIIKAKN